MADAEARAKAEKLAAAKKRVEQLKKQKVKKAETKAEDAVEAAEKPSITEETSEETLPTEYVREVEDDAGVAPQVDDSKSAEEPAGELPTTPHSHQRKPSLSVQSKMRSSSFRQSLTSPMASTPSGKAPSFDHEEDTAPEIYRKQAARIEELERDNKRLAKEATEGEKRWKKAEEELEDLREADGNRSDLNTRSQTSNRSAEELSKLRIEIAGLQRQNTQLQAHASRTGRHGSSPSISGGSLPSDDVSALLASKSSTIESMEIEISNLRAQLARTASGSTAEKEQIAALEDKLSRTQRSFDTSQRELLDLKKNLERTTEKAVKEGSERTSAETKLRTLTREAEEAQSQTADLQKKVEALEKKVLTLTILHKDHDARSQALKREREKADKEASDLRQRLANTENENLRLCEERERLKKREAQGIDDDGVDELENEERQRLETRVRDLETENFELKRGVWKERRAQMDAGGGGEESSGVTSPSAKFTDIDLGGVSPSRRRSLAGGGGGAAKGGVGGLGDLFANSFSAFTGAVAGTTAAAAASGHHPHGGSGGGLHASDGAPLLEEDDDEAEMDFDEDAFRVAQEEEARKRIERVREIKRALSDWKGWRLDLAETRRAGGEGAGEIFEV